MKLKWQVKFEDEVFGETSAFDDELKGDTTLGTPDVHKQRHELMKKLQAKYPDGQPDQFSYNLVNGE